jgi:thioesterase domain-containing protein
VYGADDRSFLVVSSLAFDSSVAGLFGTLTTGGTVVLPTDAVASDPDALIELVETTGVDATLMVPSLYRALLMRGADRPRWMRTVIVAGEACPGDLVQHHHRLRPESALWNEYGPTEATVWASVHHCVPGDDPVPIGRPIAGTTLRVIDGAGHPLAAGCSGELEISGSGVSDGYVNDADAMRHAFVESDLGRSYRTGDRTRIEGGLVWFEGRNDDQLSVNGLRVEPAEIERLLVGIDQVVDAAVSVADPRRLEEALTALGTDTARELFARASRADDPIGELRRSITARSDRAVLVAHLETGGRRLELDDIIHVLEELPPKMRPTRFQSWDRLPRTPHGKLDRACLVGLVPSRDVEPASSRSVHPSAAMVSGASHAASTDRLGSPETLAAVRAAMEGALERDLGLDDDFFRSGGDSLAALVAVTRIEEALGRSVMVTRLIEHPTARRLATALDMSEPAGRTSDWRVDPLQHPLVEWHLGDPGDRTRPLLALFAHGGNGHLLGYYDLIDDLRHRHLDHQVVGFRLPGADERTAPQPTIEAQVDGFYEVFQTIAGDRPCLLLGGSSGGLLAWEVARRRRASGHTDDTVLFMDTVHPDALRASRGSRADKYRRLWVDGGARGVFTEVRRRIEARRRLVSATKRGPVSTTMGSAQMAAVLVEESVDRSAIAFHPTSLPCRTVLLAASATDRTYTEDAWRPSAPGLVVVPVEGSHNGPDSIGAAHRVHQVGEAAVSELARLDATRRSAVEPVAR